MSEELRIHQDDAASEDEYEVISSDEVDRVVDALEALIGSVESENVKVTLEEAMETIYALVYSDEDDHLGEDLAAAA